jgi:hypothetical protein
MLGAAREQRRLPSGRSKSAAPTRSGTCGRSPTPAGGRPHQGRSREQAPRPDLQRPARAPQSAAPRGDELGRRVQTVRRRHSRRTPPAAAVAAVVAAAAGAARPRPAATTSPPTPQRARSTARTTPSGAASARPTCATARRTRQRTGRTRATTCTKPC